MFFQYLVTFFTFCLIMYAMWKVYDKYIRKEVTHDTPSTLEIKQRTEAKERRLSELKEEDKSLSSEIEVTENLKKVTNSTNRKHEKLEKLDGGESGQ